MEYKKGFTIWELMVIISIVAILFNLTIPMMSEYIFDQKSRIIATEIGDGFRFARAEAIRLNLPISICAASITSNNVLHGCKGRDKNTDWSSGMLSFIDQYKSFNYEPKMRVRYNAFDNTTINNMNIKGNSAFYLVNLDSTINLKEGRMSNICFWFISKSSRLNTNILLINKYGVSRFCNHGDYQDCERLCQ